MLSDALLDGVENIDHYLEDDLFKNMYSGELRNQVIALRNKMMALGLFIGRAPAMSAEHNERLENILNATLLGKNPNNSKPCPIFLQESSVEEHVAEFNLKPVEIIKFEDEE